MLSSGYYLATLEASIQHLMEYDEEQCKFAFFSGVSNRTSQSELDVSRSRSSSSVTMDSYRVAFLESPPPFIDSDN